VRRRQYKSLIRFWPLPIAALLFSRSYMCFNGWSQTDSKKSLAFPHNPHSPPPKYFLGGNIPRRKISAPQRRRISSDQFTHPRSLNPKKCRALSYGANPK
jgi:hypothetical protein